MMLDQSNHRIQLDKKKTKKLKINIFEGSNPSIKTLISSNEQIFDFLKESAVNNEFF